MPINFNLFLDESARGEFTDVQGLKSIHEKGLIHRDFHSGNILFDNFGCYISDFGLCRPVDEKNDGKIYGVLPYVVPEVLCDKKYTQASDIYSLEMVAYGLFSSKQPLAEYAYNRALSFRICEGLRPNLEEVIAPQLLKDLISRCWDADPEQRPTTGEVKSILGDWLDNNWFVKKNTEFYHQYQQLLATKEIDLLTSKSPRNYSAEKHTSKLLDFPNLSEPVDNKELSELFYNTRQLDLSLDLTELSISEDLQEESSLQTQIQIPPKNNLN